MKSFNIDRKLKDKDLIRLAIIKVCKNKRKKNQKPTAKYLQARRILAHLDEYTEQIHKIVCAFEEKQAAERVDESTETYTEAYTPSAFKSFERKCDGNGKIRQIACVPLYPDQIIHQLIILAGAEVFMRGMYEYSCGSIPGRGVHKGKRYLERYINRHIKQNSGAIKYAAQLDITKCYPNIRHSYLKELLRKKFRGNLFVSLCFAIIDSYREPGTEAEPVGLPIGYYTSQWFCNFVLTPLDHFIKQDLHMKGYVRYMDDMVFFGANKKELHKAVTAIIEKAATIGLTIKRNWQVFRFDYISRKDGKHRGRALDFLGFRFFRDKLILRKRLALAIRRAAAKLKKSKQITTRAAMSFMSRIGWLRHCNSFRFWAKYVKPFVNIKKIKEVIRNESRKYSYANIAV